MGDAERCSCRSRSDTPSCPGLAAIPAPEVVHAHGSARPRRSAPSVALGSRSSTIPVAGAAFTCEDGARAAPCLLSRHSRCRSAPARPSPAPPRSASPRRPCQPAPAWRCALRCPLTARTLHVSVLCPSSFCPLHFLFPSLPSQPFPSIPPPAGFYPVPNCPEGRANGDKNIGGIRR